MYIYVSHNFVLFQAKAIALAAKNGKLEFLEFQFIYVQIVEF